VTVTPVTIEGFNGDKIQVCLAFVQPSNCGVFVLGDYIAVEQGPDALHRQWPEGHGHALDPGRHLRTGTPHAEANPPESARQQYGWALSSAPQPQLSRREGPQNQAAWTLPTVPRKAASPGAAPGQSRAAGRTSIYARLELTIPNQSFQYRTAGRRAVIYRHIREVGRFGRPLVMANASRPTVFLCSGARRVNVRICRDG
jgi:hypothetical protein